MFKDVVDKSLEDRMESFFLSETIKYLYLTFDTENYLNKNGESFIFTTEGHFLPINLNYFSKSSNKKKNLNKKCDLKMSSEDYFKKIQRNLPMKIKYFEKLFDMVGVDDNLDKLLDRKSN